MPQDAVGDPRVCNKGDNLHAGATPADQGINFEDLLQQARPCASSLLGELGIILVRVNVCRGTGAIVGGG